MPKEVNSGLLLECVHLSNEICQSVLKEPICTAWNEIGPLFKTVDFNWRQIAVCICSHSL